MFKISYYVKRQITNRIIDIGMIILLILTLFPIGWMIYASVKENNDILVGKVSLSYARNDVKTIYLDKNYYYVCTTDGGINKYRKGSNLLSGYGSANTMATNFDFDDKYIWVSSANNWLQRFDKSDLKKSKRFKLPLRDIDINKIVSTVMVRDGDYLWYSLRYRGFEGIVEFDTKHLYATRIFDLKCDLSPVQIMSLNKVSDSLFVGTDMGLLEVSLKDRKVVAEYNLQETFPGGITGVTLNEGGILLGSATGAGQFDLKKKAIVKRYGVATGLLSDLVESVLIEGDNIYFGSNAGLSILNKKTGEVKNIETLFNPLKEETEIIKGLFTTGLVSAIGKEKEILYLGSTMGRTSFFDLASNRLRIETLQGKRGHLVIAWRNYLDMWKNVDFGLYLRNSFFICGVSMMLAMILATLAAYAVSRFNFPGSRLFSVSILATQMIPGIIFLIPIYSMFVKFTEFTGIPLKGTFYGIIFIYTAYFVPFSIWILRGFFAAIPIDLEEAARIDGCSPIQVFWHIVLPLAIPGIIATGIFIFLTVWDELMFAWILTSADTMTVPVGIRNFVGNYQNRFDLIMAASTVATIPVMILFFMLQKHIVKGLTAGAVKG
ncbi:MAG: carbohydrate ABC transporter permease [Candidatus Saganbacteria bacterium]|nr:carbohydrate ABC transporter permease [Candidatus Saganbacteria bacterium]